MVLSSIVEIAIVESVCSMRSSIPLERPFPGLMLMTLQVPVKFGFMSCPNAAEARNSRRVILLVCMRVFLQQRQRLVAENTVSSALRFPQSQVIGNFDPVVS